MIDCFLFKTIFSKIFAMTIDNMCMIDTHIAASFKMFLFACGEDSNPFMEHYFFNLHVHVYTHFLQLQLNICIFFP